MRSAELLARPLVALLLLLALPAAGAWAQAGAPVSATEESPCPPGAERTGAKPPAGDRSGCVLATDDGPVLHGPQTWWYPGGTKRQETNFLNGKLHGPKYDWGIRGSLMQKWEYENGVLHGDHVIYSPAGSVMRRQRYAEGQQVSPATAKATEPPAEKPAAAKPPEPARERPKPVAQPKPRPAPKPRRVAFTCDLLSDTLDQRIAEDRKFFEELTRGQLRLVVSPERLKAVLVTGPDEPPRIDGAFSYRLEATNELGFASNDPIQETVREREMGMLGVSGLFRDRFVDLLRQWKQLMSESKAVTETASDVVLHEADLQKISGQTLPARLSYSETGGNGAQSEIRLRNCRATD